MKAVVIANFDTTGGTRSVLKELLKLHSELRIDTTLVYRKDFADEEIESLVSGLLFKSRRLSTRANGHRLYTNFFLELIEYWKVIKDEKVDLVVVSSGNQFGELASFFMPRPVAYFLFSTSTRIGPKARPIFSIIKLLLGKRKYVICDSAFSRQRLTENWRLNEASSKVIYNSFGDKAGTCTSNERKIVLTLGQLHEYKNPFLWIEMSKKLSEQFPQIEFLWLGDGPLYDECKSLVDGYSRIKFLGHRKDVYNFYSLALVYVQPSLIESHGIAVVDALACGVPCVVSNVGGLPESVHSGLNGFVVNLEDGVDGFVKSVHNLLSDHDLRAGFSVHAKLDATIRFSRQIKKEKIQRLYDEII